MQLCEMTPSCWRCRNGVFAADYNGQLICKENIDRLNINERKCAAFRPSETAVAFFAGAIKGSQAHTLASIYLSRQKRGVF